VADFAQQIIRWQKKNGRHDLPWQGTTDPYAIWVSEIMLQQTRVTTVIPYYRRFLARFPDVGSLAAAPLDEVLALWSGLGYYARARNLHRAAAVIMSEYGGRFPQEFDAVCALPGVGRSTAAAICVFAFGARRAILDGNVRRVLTRYFGIRRYPGEKRVLDALWRHAETLLPDTQIVAYTQGLMDLGAGVCVHRNPRCTACPVAQGCVAHDRRLTDRIPAPKPGKAQPIRQTVMLVLEHAGEILLEKRPPAGIWGGLWCLPEIEADADLEAVCVQRFDVDVDGSEKLPAIEHGFTHLRLIIRPWRLRVARLARGVREPGHVWVALEDARRAAIPAPVRRILSML
jgi:A/G-specific adenine glycosylase